MKARFSFEAKGETARADVIRIWATHSAARDISVRENFPSSENFGEASKSAREAHALPSASALAFTVIELLVVVVVILVLAGFVLSTSSYVHNKGGRSRAEAEIAALSAALENYKADNGVYPRDGNTDGLDARAKFDPTATATPTFTQTSIVLYRALVGDTEPDGIPGPGKIYIAFKSGQLGGSGPGTFLSDPFGYSYGYSTSFQSDSTKGYNPTFDLWSTAGSISNNTSGWIKNW